MGLFQSVFSITEDSDANLDQFQYQGGTYKKLDIDAVALVSNANQQDYSPKRPRKCYTAPRKRNYDKPTLHFTSAFQNLYCAIYLSNMNLQTFSICLGVSRSAHEILPVAT